MQSVLNVRMDSALKERGDKVLSEHGVSVSNAVRALWTELSETRVLPDFMKRNNDAEMRKESKRNALRKLCMLGELYPQTPQKNQIPDDSELMDAVYQDMLDQYEALQ